MRAVLAYHNVQTRKVWLADSFEGLPEPDVNQNLEDAVWHHILSVIQNLKSSRMIAENAFHKVGLLDEQVVFLEGWFDKTLPGISSGEFSLIRLDGDWYESTQVGLNHLYPKLSSGGYIIIDDYGLPTGCSKAVDEYRLQNAITSPLISINKQAVYWRKD